MSLFTVVIVAYFSVNLIIAFWARRLHSRGQEGFFLADRRLSPFVFFVSLAATNFSAFTIFGFSGAGYRLGYAFYPLMAFGTGFMALSFVIIGLPLRKFAAARGYITPADFIHDRYQSLLLKKAFSACLVIFMIPYLALQGMFAGKILHHFAGLPYELGCFVVLAVVTLYTASGGMRSVAWTDVFQGFFILICVSLAFFIVVNAGGGFVAIQERVFSLSATHFNRAGSNGSISFSVHIGYILLWFFSVPLFPQIFQRFYSAKDDKAILNAMCFYPLATTLLFFMTVAIGVMAVGILPTMSASGSDEVMMAIAKFIPSPILSTLIIVGALAALMSTLSSQLLSLSSIIVQDFLADRNHQLLHNRIVIVAISLSAFVISLHPPLTILGFLNKLSFQGFASCAPAVFLGLLWKRTTALGALIGLALGVSVTFLGVMNLLPSGIPDIFFILSVGFGATILGSLFTTQATSWRFGNISKTLAQLVHQTPTEEKAPRLKKITETFQTPLDSRFRGNDHNKRSVAVAQESFSETISPLWWVIFGAILFWGCDFWHWGGNGGEFLFGLPRWLWHFFVLGGVMFLAFLAFSQKRPRH
ncbi:MAG: sodium:solute symporter family protein [Deltaproteobacteria bacterium]|nr:sodium:solute symporter family protein [Deltaproteobacteria bacterium]